MIQKSSTSSIMFQFASLGLYYRIMESFSLGHLKTAEDIPFPNPEEHQIGEKVRGQTDLLSQKYKKWVLGAIEITGPFNILFLNKHYVKKISIQPLRSLMLGSHK